MKSMPLHFRLIKLPHKMDVILFLIREELKSRRLFSILQKAGLQDCDYQPHLDELILASMGLDDDVNETFDFYSHLMDRRSKKLEPGNDSATRQAMKVYEALMMEKKRRG